MFNQQTILLPNVAILYLFTALEKRVTILCDRNFACNISRAKQIKPTKLEIRNNIHVLQKYLQNTRAPAFCDL